MIKFEVGKTYQGIIIDGLDSRRGELTIVARSNSTIATSNNQVWKIHEGAEGAECTDSSRYLFDARNSLENLRED